MGGIATMMFVALFAFGSQMMGWDDADGKIRLAIFAAYVFGIIGGYRARA